MEQVIASVLMLAMIAGVGAWLVVENRSRKAALSKVQAEIADTDLSFVERDNSLFVGLTVNPFELGLRRSANEVLRNEAGTFASFTYRWSTGSSKRNEHTRRVTWIKAGPVLPRLEVEPDTAVAKVRTAVEGGDHDVELSDFNKAWSVRASDDRVGHAVLHPRMIERLMKDDLYGRTVFFEDGRIGVVDYVIQLADLADHAVVTRALLEQLADLIPDHLRKEFS